MDNQQPKEHPIAQVGETLRHCCHANEKLLLNHIELAYIVDNANSMIIKTDSLGRITFWNRYAEKYFGYSVEEVLGKTMLDLCIPVVESSGRDLGQFHSDLLRHPEKYKNHFNENITKDGKRVWAAWSNHAVYHPDGSLKELISIGNDATYLQRVKQALRQSEQKFRRLAETTAAMLYIVRHGRFVYANHYAEELTGYTVNELVSKEVAAIIHPSDREAVVQHMARGNHANAQYETRILTKLGEEKWVVISGSTLEFDNERSLIGVATDITERKHYEEQLRKLTVAVEQSPSSVVITDKEGRIEYINAKFSQVTGYTSQEAIGQSPRILKSGVQGPEVYEELWQTISAGREWHGEFHNKRKDGSLYWERASISPLRNSTGVITHYVALKEDITAWKQTQEELNFAHAQMHELFNSAPDATAVISTDHTVLLVNDTLARFLGADKSELQGQKCHEILHNSMCDTADCPIRRIMSGEERVEADIHICNADQISTLCMFTAIPYRPGGKLLGIIETFKDMTERKRTEEAMRNDFLLGAQIQRQFLPQPFSNDKVGVDIVYQPYNHVSGDLCDCLWLTDSKLFGYVIDVMGHGLATALQTSALRVLFRQAALRQGTVGDKMTWLNQAALPYFAEDSFAGAICFEMDFETMTLSYVSAGINFFVAATSQVQGIVSLPGLFLGIVENLEFETHTVPLACGDAYYFVTDGIFDILDETIIANSRNYLATVQALQDKAISSKRWDDATALCLQINAFSPKPLTLSFDHKQDFRNTRSRLRHILEQAAGNKAGLLEVAINEAANNAVRSAEAANRPFEVQMKLQRKGRWLVVRIRDSGDGFDGNGAVAAIEGAGCDLFEQAMLAESGRGIMIMKALFQKVRYNRIGNEVLLARNLEIADCI